MNDENLILQLKALGEPTRLRLATLLADREWGGTELLSAMQVSQPNLSRHLKMLREAGVIRERRVGRNAYYQLEKNTLGGLVVRLATGDPKLSALNINENASNFPKTGFHDSVEVPTPEETPDQGDRDAETPRTDSIEEWLL